MLGFIEGFFPVGEAKPFNLDLMEFFASGLQFGYRHFVFLSPLLRVAEGWFREV